MSYPSIDFKSNNFEADLCRLYDEYGVCVITNVFTPNECNNIMDNIVSSFEKLGTGVNRKDPKTWNNYNLPVMTRPGMFQASMCNLPIIWKVRTDDRINNIFTILYEKFRGTDDLIVSTDGINIKHAGIGPFHDVKNDFDKDWCHLDQTVDADRYKCIQGQLVMTNTTSAFRCTPKSHDYLYQILSDHSKLGDSQNWFKFNNTEKKEIKEFLEKKGCEWQIPIYCPQGSFIVWNSALIHSAKFADKPDGPTKTDPWKGWRGVLYICYRPRSDMRNGDIAKKIKNIKENRVMNHWGTKTFPHMPGGGYQRHVQRHKIINELTKEPTKVYEILGIVPKDIYSDEQIMKCIA
jgi:hypothetical protein